MALGRKAWKSQAVAHGLEQNEKFSIELTAIPKELAVSLADSNYRVRRIAMDTLELLGADSIQVTPRIITALDDSDRFVRWAAIRALGEMGPSVREEALPKLTQMLQDQDGDVRKAAAQAVARLKLK
jgi:HEAT repeat protein